MIHQSWKMQKKKCLQQEKHLSTWAANRLALPVDKPLLCDWLPCHQFSALGELFCLPGQDVDLIKTDSKLWTRALIFPSAASLNGAVKRHKSGCQRHWPRLLHVDMQRLDGSQAQGHTPWVVSPLFPFLGQVQSGSSPSLIFNHKTDSELHDNDINKNEQSHHIAVLQGGG